MRSLTLSIAVLLAAASASMAQGSAVLPKRDTPPTANRPTALAPQDNQAARKTEDERQKRWDDRMRRATRSLCDRC